MLSNGQARLSAILLRTTCSNLVDGSHLTESQEKMDDYDRWAPDTKAMKKIRIQIVSQSYPLTTRIGECSIVGDMTP